jgi:RNA polymerase sigma factor (sigma-70 family)
MPPRALGAESWDALFDFLDPDRPKATGADRDRIAEARCAQILRKLVSFFAGRHCAEADDLAMETVLRVASKCRDLDLSADTNRIGYFSGVARNLLHESYRSAARESTRLRSLRRELGTLPDPDVWEREELVQSCLDRCMAGLTRRARHLVVRYYESAPSEKVAAHRTLADESGKSLNALRIEVHRIRKALLECMSDCLGPAGPAAGGSSA